MSFTTEKDRNSGVVAVELGEYGEKFSHLFGAVEEVVEYYFKRFSWHPIVGSINIDEHRYILVRAQSFFVAFFEYLTKSHKDGGRHYRDTIYTMSHVMGRKDAKVTDISIFRDTRPVLGLNQALCGQVVFCFCGVAKVRFIKATFSKNKDEFLFVYEHLKSVESEAFITSTERLGDDCCPNVPICAMSCGYSAGWISGCYNLDLESFEISCRGLGHKSCIFVMAHRGNLLDRITSLVENDELPCEKSELILPKKLPTRISELIKMESRRIKFQFAKEKNIALKEKIRRLEKEVEELTRERNRRKSGGSDGKEEESDGKKKEESSSEEDEGEIEEEDEGEIEEEDEGEIEEDER